MAYRCYNICITFLRVFLLLSFFFLFELFRECALLYLDFIRHICIFQISNSQASSSPPSPCFFCWFCLFFLFGTKFVYFNFVFLRNVPFDSHVPRHWNVIHVESFCMAIDVTSKKPQCNFVVSIASVIKNGFLFGICVEAIRFIVT